MYEVVLVGETVLFLYNFGWVTLYGACPGGVLERWSATENVTGAPERSEKKGWSARVLELRKTSWSAGKLRKIGRSAGALILNCLERWSARQKIVGAWSRGMYWSAGALKEKEVELWSATKKGLERWSAVTPGRAPSLGLLVFH